MGSYCAGPAGRIHGLSIFPAEVLFYAADLEGSASRVGKLVEDEFTALGFGFPGEDGQSADSNTSKAQDPGTIQFDPFDLLGKSFFDLFIKLKNRRIAGAIRRQVDFLGGLGSFLVHAEGFQLRTSM